MSETPAVWVWKRSHCDFSLCAPKTSRIHRAQIRRAARNLAISSKKSTWASKKNDSPGAKTSTSRPRESPSSTYPKPSASVNASSCAAVEPASRMW